MISELADIWAQQFATNVYPDVNCWNSLIEALTRTRHYKEAYEIVQNFLKDCIDARKGVVNKVRTFPDVKFAQCCIQFLCRRPFGGALNDELKESIPARFKNSLNRLSDSEHRTYGKRLLTDAEIVTLANTVDKFFLAWKAKTSGTAPTAAAASASASTPANSGEAKPFDEYLTTEEDVSAAQSALTNLADLLMDEPETGPLQLILEPKTSQRVENGPNPFLSATKTPSAGDKAAANDIFGDEAKIESLSPKKLNLGFRAIGAKSRGSASILQSLRRKK
jgi:pentatricopeptide repeat protein